MCQEDTMIPSGSTNIWKLEWSIMKSEWIKILYNSVFCSIILHDATGTYYIIQIKTQIFKWKDS